MFIFKMVIEELKGFGKVIKCSFFTYYRETMEVKMITYNVKQ